MVNTLLKREEKKTSKHQIPLNTINYTKFAAHKWNVIFPHTALPKHFTLHHLISLALVFHRNMCLILQHFLCIHSPVLATRMKKKNDALLPQSLVSLHSQHFSVTTCSPHCSSHHPNSCPKPGPGKTWQCSLFSSQCQSWELPSVSCLGLSQHTKALSSALEHPAINALWSLLGHHLHLPLQLW